MKPKGLIQCLIVVCAFALFGCKNTTNSANSGSASTGGADNSSATNSATANSSNAANSAQPGSNSDSGSTASSGPLGFLAPKPVMVRRGTEIVVTADQSVSSKTNNSGDHFDASLAEPVVVGDHVVIPKGAHARGTVVEAKSAGRFKGNAELTVAISSVTVKGKVYRVKTTEVTESGKGRGKRTAEGAGGGAVVGGLIGALAGHGKGAAIGAAAGAGAGTAGAAATGERDITIDSESKLSFKLEDSLELQEK